MHLRRIGKIASKVKIDEYSCRLLHDICGRDTRRTLTEYESLMDRLADLKILNERAQKMLMEVSPTDMEPLLLEMFDR